jgi:hypothetical protein
MLRSVVVLDFQGKISRKLSKRAGGIGVGNRTFCQLCSHANAIRKMSQTHKSQALVIRTAIFAASIALLMLGKCDASCGEYVYSRFRTPTHHDTIARQFPEPSFQHVAKSELTQTPGKHGISQDSTGFPVPCSGPNCTKNPTPSLPFAPPATMGGSSQDRLIHYFAVVDLASEASRRRDLESLARPERGFPLLIEMPPEIAG